MLEDKPLEAHRQADGEIKLTDTGDDLIDLWEQQLEEGIDPNLEDAFNPESLGKIQKTLQKAKEQQIIHNYSSMKDTIERVEKEAKAQGLTNKLSPFGSRR